MVGLLTPCHEGVNTERNNSDFNKQLCSTCQIKQVTIMEVKLYPYMRICYQLLNNSAICKVDPRDTTDLKTISTGTSNMNNDRVK